MNKILYTTKSGTPIYTASYANDDDIPSAPDNYRCVRIDVNSNDEELISKFWLNDKDELVERGYAPSHYHTWDISSQTWIVRLEDIKAAKVSSQKQIDIAAGDARSRYITTVPGQDSTYAAKYDEALAYIAAGYPDDLTNFPYISAESRPNTWMSPTQAATRIATIGGYWRDVIGPKIEALRINGKDALEPMDNIEQIELHTKSIISELNAI